MPGSFRWFAFVMVATASLLPRTARAENYAFIVGVNVYDKRGFDDLSYAEPDSQVIAAELKKVGFQTILLTGSATGDDRATLANINRRLDTMLQGVNRRDIVLVVLAGHGQQLEIKHPDGQMYSDSFFCPVDAILNDPASQFSLTYLLDEQLAKRGGKNLVLVDACRDEPRVPRGGRRSAAGDSSSKKPTKKRGIQGRTIALPEDTAVLFSCRAGQSSLEAEDLGHGLFSHCVIEGLRGQAAREGQVTWTSLVDYVTERMASPELREFMDPRNPQEPIPVGGIGGRLVLAKLAPSRPPASPKPTLPATFKSSATPMEFVLIPAGEFLMGSSEAAAEAAYEELKATSENANEVKREWFTGETPSHRVKITSFYLGTHEVTRGAFRKFVESTGYKTDAEKDGKGGLGLKKSADGSRSFAQDVKFSWRDCGFAQDDSHPVVNVSWNDAVAFAKWLSREDGRTYRLPTEAEWEYACRAGSTGRFSFGDDAEEMARHENIADASYQRDGLQMKFGKQISSDDGSVFTSKVGRYRPNAWGLYDMHGNVVEWCNDTYGANYYGESPLEDPPGPSEGAFRVLRGGGWYGLPVSTRSAFRDWNSPDRRDFILGFRLASSSRE